MRGSPTQNSFFYDTLCHAIAGSAGSVVAMTVFYPLDTVRSRLQLEDREAKSFWKVIDDLVREEGLETLYRGIIPVLESLAASNFIHFYAYNGLLHVTQSEAPSPGKSLLYASIAGVINVLLTTPLWVVSTRLKMEGIKNEPRRKYNGIIDGLIKVKKSEGWKGLWSGTVPSLMLVSNPAIQFMVYQTLKQRRQKLSPNDPFGRWTIFLIGAFSKAVATTLTYPLQLVQAQLRHGKKNKDLPKDAGIADLMRHIIRTQGSLGLYKGMEARIVQTVLAAALMFTSYETIASFLFKLLGYQKSKPV